MSQLRLEEDQYKFLQTLEDSIKTNDKLYSV